MTSKNVAAHTQGMAIGIAIGLSTQPPNVYWGYFIALALFLLGVAFEWQSNSQ